LLHRILNSANAAGDGGSFRFDEADVERFIANPDNPFLVSFPRTGSHWLRMIMELYFERPMLVRAFYYPQNHHYLALHTHDLALDVERANVLYLYRDPVDTIYSQLRYHQEAPDDTARIIYWSDLYGQHLDKWLCREKTTRQKTILTYEGMKRDLATEFANVTAHFEEALDLARLEAAASRVTKDEVKRKTTHDTQVVQLEDHYQTSRQAFRDRFQALVWETLTLNREQLRAYLESKR
jgi:hypothetical protein